MRIGPYQIANTLILAPMAGVTDRPFRQLCRSMGAGLAVWEMVTSNSLLYGSAKTRRRADHAGEAPPVSVQIAGADPSLMAEAARYNVETGAQIVDINMSIAFNYVSQKKGDAHTLLIGTTALLTNHIVGTRPLSYMDFTPIASLFNDYVVFAVNANSPIKTGKDLIAKLKENPQSVSIGFATTLGSHNHIAAGLLAKSVGVNARNLKAIAFKGSSEAITQVLGGHIDMVTTAAGNVASHLAEGRLRVIGISSDKRFPGAFAQVPTWKEQGANLVYGGWRAIMGPKGLTPEQIAYWEGVLRRVASTPDWKADLEKNYWYTIALPTAWLWFMFCFQRRIWIRTRPGRKASLKRKKALRTCDYYFRLTPWSIP